MGSESSAQTDPELSAKRSGHPEISWSIVVDVTLSDPLEPAAIRARVGGEWAKGSRPGHLPSVLTAGPGDFASHMQAFADRPYLRGDALFRILLADRAREEGSPSFELKPHVCVAAHHSVVDGFGVLSFISLVLGQPVRARARGLAPDTPTRSAGLGYTARRVLEGLLTPPTKVAPERVARGDSVVDGDEMVRTDLSPARITTAALAAAAVAAVKAWNGRRGLEANRVRLAIGVSRRPGDAGALDDRSAYIRLPVSSHHPEAIRQQLERAAPEPEPGRAAVTASRMPLASLIRNRMGSTLLLSNIGVVEAPPGIQAIALYAVGHGRSGVGIGCTTVNDRTVLTLRARRSEFTREGAASLLGLMANELILQPHPLRGDGSG